MISVDGPADGGVGNTFGDACEIDGTLFPGPHGFVVHGREGGWKFDGQMAIFIGSRDFVFRDTFVKSIVVAKDVFDGQDSDGFAFGIVGNAAERYSVIVRLDTDFVRIRVAMFAEKYFGGRSSKSFARYFDCFTDRCSAIEKFHYFWFTDYRDFDYRLGLSGCVVRCALIFSIVLTIHVCYRQQTEILVDPETIGSRKILSR